MRLTSWDAVKVAHDEVGYAGSRLSSCCERLLLAFDSASMTPNSRRRLVTSVLKCFLLPCRLAYVCKRNATKDPNAAPRNVTMAISVRSGDGSAPRTNIRL